MSVQKTIQDYWEQLYAEFPTLPKEDIRRACNYGWKSLYLANSRGADTLVIRNRLWLYCGSLMCNSIKYFNYYARKMVVKLRIMYERKRIPWDGYYYFSLSKSQYEKYLTQKNKKGRPRKNFTFNKVLLFKIMDECSINNHNHVAIFRIPYIIEKGYRDYKETLTTSQAELLLVREPLKFKEILLSEYNYQFISDNLRRYKNKNNEQ